MRRLAALLSGLPPEAAVWRQNELSTVEQLLDAQNGLLHDIGERLIEAWLAKPGQRVQMPAPPPRFLPAVSETPKAAPIVETDPRKIAAFFARR